MIKNYFKVAFRNLVTNKLQAFINIAGLSVGMAVAMLIGFWIWDELSFDKYNPGYDRIAQVKQNLNQSGEVNTWTTVPYPLAEELRRKYGSDFKYVVLSTGAADHILSLDQKSVKANGGFFEPAAIQLLALDILQGQKNGLDDPSSVLLSASQATALFGNTDPIGKLLKIDNKQPVKVTGVYRDIPNTSSFANLSFIAAWQLFYNTGWIRDVEDPWRPNAFIVYTELSDHADMATVSEKIRDAKLNKVSKRLATHKPRLFLHPMSKWHLFDEFKEGINTGGRIQYVWMFGIIGSFVLLLACINFMNLSTARSEKRAKEVGIRKAIGSRRWQLIYRFFSESLVVVAFAFLLSLLWAWLSLPFFNQVAGKEISIPWMQPMFWLSCAGFSLITGLIAGCYPALYLSSFRPVKVLKGSFKAGRLALVPRKLLVVLQFTVSIILIIGTLIIFRQIQFAKNRPLGYDNNGLLEMPVSTEDIHDHFEAVRTELKNSGAILELAESQSPSTGIWNSTSGIDWKGKDPNMAADLPVFNASYDYGRTVGWQYREGRGFSRDFPTDSSALLLNEAAARLMGIRHPVGETIKWDGVPFTIIGVVKDMVVESPYEEIRPTIYGLKTNAGNFVVAKINPGISAGLALKKIGEVFRKYNPAQPFEYKFADEEYARKFGNEERIGKLAGFFATLAVFISCLGLFGMASFMAEQRVKEIGVRKVLGASVYQLWRLLSKDSVLLVGISLLIAIPAAYYFMHNWLQQYHYHTGTAWWIFLAAGLGSLVITLFTVSFQAIGAAMVNPVKSLRSE